MKEPWMRVSRSSPARWIAGLGLACLVVALAPHATAQDATGALVQGGDPPQLFVLSTGDVIGYIEPCG